MNRLFRGFVVLFGVVLVSAMLGGCGREVLQRQAFINFLQYDVLPRNTGLPLPPGSLRKKFGNYASDYDILVEFNNNFTKKIVKPMETLQQAYTTAMMPESPQSARREATVQYRNFIISQLSAMIEDELAATEAKIKLLNQPDDLKDVYTQTVNKYIRQPSRTLQEIIPAVADMLNRNLELLDYVDANAGKIEIKDGFYSVKDPAISRKLVDLQSAITASAQRVQDVHSEIVQQPIGSSGAQGTIRSVSPSPAAPVPETPAPATNPRPNRNNNQR